MEKNSTGTLSDASKGAEARSGFFGGLAASIKGSFTKGKDGVEAPIYDAAVFAIAFLFARCHLIFGAYPIAIGAIAVLPTRVWPAVLGALAGSLTLGQPGIIYAIISVIVAFLRIIISATDKKREGSDADTLFKESLVLRMSCALIGGFIVAVYEILLSALTLESVLFGVSMVALPPLCTLALSGLFGVGISPRAIFLERCELLSPRKADKSDHAALTFFRVSALFAVFLISISMGAYELLGISAGFVFASLAALFAARRFGAIAGAAVGFAASVGLSGSYCAAFTLAGLVGGAVSGLGIASSVLLGGAVLGLWGGYVGGAVGFLGVFPEYAIAAALAIPLFKRTRLERTAEEIESAEQIASDMVGTMALSYKSRYSGSLDTLEAAFASISRITKEARQRDAEISRAELSRLCSECICRYFDTDGVGLPGGGEARSAFLAKIEHIVPIIASGRKLSREDFDMPGHLSLITGGITEAINRAVGIITEEAYRERTRDTSGEVFDYLSKLINEARVADYSERSPNEKLKAAAEGALRSLGISGYAVQVFGERRPHFLIAFEDEGGGLITSAALKEALESASGALLSAPEFYRKGKIALMECSARPRIKAISASVGSAMSREASGDTSRSFESGEGRYFSLISDGMGSGDDAVRTSSFVADFLVRALEFGKGTETSLRLLNDTLKRRRKECSATVDLFSLDLLCGEATFHKCGAAPSYIKRGQSLFRIRSRTSPIGLSGELDAERIRVEPEVGDMIIMFSDGVSADGEAAWLLDAISGKDKDDPRLLAEAVLDAAKRQGAPSDDMTVTVTRIERAG